MFEVAVSPVLRVTDVLAPRGRDAAALDLAVCAAPSAEVVGLLARVEPDRLDDVDRVRLLQAWERASRWVAAQHAKAVVAVAGRRPSGRDDVGREHVRVALVGAGGSPKACVDTARALAAPLAEAAAALERGEISEAHVRVLVAETGRLDPATAREVVGKVLGRAVGRTPSQFRRAVRRAVISADPVGAELGAERAGRERRVVKEVLDDAQAQLTLTGPAVDVMTMWAALDLRAARAAATDARTLDQRRFDAAVALCREGDLRTDLHAGSPTPAGSAPGGPQTGSGSVGSPAGSASVGSPTGRRGSPRRRGLLPTVHVYADAATWAGLADEPVDLDGYGPVPAGTARALMGSTAWRAVVTDALTQLPVAVSDRTYRPGPRTERLLRLRDRGCLMPGCAASAVHCDADHNLPHDRSGCTDADNCGFLCRRHHRLKTFTRWRWRREADGTTTWTDPHGLVWHRPPDRYPLPPPEPEQPTPSPDPEQSPDPEPPSRDLGEPLPLPDDPPF